MENKKINIERLVRVSTYSKIAQISIQEVHRRIKKGTIKAFRIDEVWFVYT